MSLQNLRLFFPVNITLFCGDTNNPNIEPYFTAGICPHYVQAVNRAILEYPMTNAGVCGLMKYFACEDELISLYAKGNITNALPQIAYFVDMKLYGVVTYTVDSDSDLPEPVVDALKADLRRQLTEEWGRSEFDITINEGILYLRDGIYHLDWKPADSVICVNAEFEELQKATLNVRFQAEDLSFIDTLEELKSRLANS